MMINLLMLFLYYLKKSEPDKTGKAPIMGRITLNRTMAQCSCKLSCTPGPVSYTHLDVYKRQISVLSVQILLWEHGCCLYIA